MKLITEVCENIVVDIQEAKEPGGKKSYFIEGVFMQGDITNRNSRMYPKSVLEPVVKKYIDEHVSKHRAYGELGHPQGPTINLERVSHMIKEIRQEGANFIGRAKIMDTPYGQIVKNLIDEGASLGVSSRGMGSLKQNKEGITEVQNDFYLATAADIVADPSAPDAFVRGIMEGVEYWFNPAGVLVSQKIDQVEQMQAEAKKMTRKQLEEQKLRMFNKYMNIIGG